MSTISLIVLSTSASAAQKEAAEFFFGKGYLKVLDVLEKLSKSKVIATPHVRGLLLMMRDGEDSEIIAFNKGAATKKVLEAAKALAVSKTADASLKNLDKIRVPAKWIQAADKTRDVTKPVPKVKVPKDKTALKTKETLKVGEEVKSATPSGAPQIPDKINRSNPDTKVGKLVNAAVLTFGNAGYPLHDHDILLSKNGTGSYMIRVYPKVTNNPREDLAYTLIVHPDGTYTYGVYDKDGKGKSYGTETRMKQAVGRVIHFIETENPTNANAFKVAGGHGKERDDHKSEALLVDEISDIDVHKLNARFNKFIPHLSAIGTMIARNVTGVSYTPIAKGLNIEYNKEDFATLKLTSTHWELKRKQKTVNIGDTLDISTVIDELKTMILRKRK